jgi:hypothetical protein
VHLRIPQTCDYHDDEGRPFSPNSLDRGVRSERAMTLAVAEMYVQGVSTRKVTKIVEQLCGLQVTSTQVSRAAAELDDELAAWRSRPLGEVTYLTRASPAAHKAKTRTLVLGRICSTNVLHFEVFPPTTEQDARRRRACDGVRI